MVDNGRGSAADVQDTGLTWDDRPNFQAIWAVIQQFDVEPVDDSNNNNENAVEQQPPIESRATSEKKAYIIKEEFLYAWHGYAKYAMGHDEILPVSDTAVIAGAGSAPHSLMRWVP